MITDVYDIIQLVESEIYSVEEARDLVLKYLDSSCIGDVSTHRLIQLMDLKILTKDEVREIVDKSIDPGGRLIGT